MAPTDSYGSMSVNHNRQKSAKSSHCADAEWEAVGVWGDVGSNLSFTAKFKKRKPLILLEKVGSLWFLAPKK